MTLSVGGLLAEPTLLLPPSWAEKRNAAEEYAVRPANMQDRMLFIWMNVEAVESSGSMAVLPNIGTTPDDLVGRLTSDADYLIVSPPVAVTLGQGIKATRLTVGVSMTAKSQDPECPARPRCADLFNTNGGVPGAYGIGGTEEVELYFAQITINRKANTLVVALYSENRAVLLAFEPQAQPILDSLRLPAGAASP